jgi:hypothetical protein
MNSNVIKEMPQIKVTGEKYDNWMKRVVLNNRITEEADRLFDTDEEKDAFIKGAYYIIEELGFISAK